MASKKSFDHSASSLPPEDIRMSYTRADSVNYAGGSIHSIVSNNLSHWVSEPSREESQFGSTIDVAAIKRFPMFCEEGSTGLRSAQQPLITIPDNWESIDVDAARNYLKNDHSEDSDDSDDSVSSCSHSASDSGSECSDSESSSSCSSNLSPSPARTKGRNPKPSVAEASQSLRGVTPKSCRSDSFHVSVTSVKNTVEDCNLVSALSSRCEFNASTSTTSNFVKLPLGKSKAKSIETITRPPEHRNPPTLASKKFFEDDKFKDGKVSGYPVSSRASTTASSFSTTNASLGLPDSSLGTRLSLPDGPSRLDDGGEDPVVNFHGLNGGLQVIEDADLVAILNSSHNTEIPNHVIQNNLSVIQTKQANSNEDSLASANHSSTVTSSVPSLTPTLAKSSYSVITQNPLKRKNASAKKQKSKSALTTKSTNGTEWSNGLGFQVQPFQTLYPNLIASSVAGQILHTGRANQVPQTDYDIYLNSSTSNVSPDSGNQSEGINDLSPLHMGESISSPITTMTTYHRAPTTNLTQASPQALINPPPQMTQTFGPVIQSWSQSHYYRPFIAQSTTGSLFRAGVQAHFGPPALVVATDVTQTSHFTTTHAWGQKSPGFVINSCQNSPSTSSTLQNNSHCNGTTANSIIASVSSSFSKHTYNKVTSRKPKLQKIRPAPAKKVTIDCGIQTMESCLDKNYREDKPPVLKSNEIVTISDSDSGDDSSPPPPLYMGYGGTSPPSQRRSRKTPPILTPEVPLENYMPPILKPEVGVSSSKSKDRASSRSPNHLSASLRTQDHEILLDSDDESTLYSDNDDGDDLDDEVEENREMPLLSPICNKNDEPSVSTTPESSISTDLPFLTRSSDYVSEGDTGETVNSKCLEDTRTKEQSSSCHSSVNSDELPSKRLKTSRHLSPIKLLNEVPTKKYCRKKKQLTEHCNRKAEEVTDTTSESSASIRKGKLPRRRLKERVGGGNDVKAPRSRSRLAQGDKKCDNGQPKINGTIKNEGKSKRGRKPKRPFQTDATLSSRQELEALEEEGLNLELICFNITEDDMKIDKVVPIFHEKYRNLDVGDFLKSPSQKVVDSNSGTSSVLTKAALKETVAPPATCSSVQTMLKALAGAFEKKKRGRKPKKDRRPAFLADLKHQTKRSLQETRTGNSTASDDLDYSHSESQESGRESKHKKKKKKHKKKKRKADEGHEDPMDKVFCGLALELEKVALSNPTGVRSVRTESSKNLSPSIFRTFNYLGQIIGRVPKPAAKRGRPKKNPLESRRSEQRLPLKKRYHEVNKDQNHDQIDKIHQKAKDAPRRSPGEGRRKAMRVSSENSGESSPAPSLDTECGQLGQADHLHNEVPGNIYPSDLGLKKCKEKSDQDHLNLKVDSSALNKTTYFGLGGDHNTLEERRKKNEKDLESRFDEILLNTNTARLKPVDHAKDSPSDALNLSTPLFHPPKSETPPPPVLEPVGKDGDLMSSSEWDEPPILEMEVGAECSGEFPSLLPENTEIECKTLGKRRKSLDGSPEGTKEETTVHACSLPSVSTNEIPNLDKATDGTDQPLPKKRRGRLPKAVTCSVENPKTEVVALVTDQNSTFEVTVTVEDATETESKHSSNEDDRIVGRPKRNCAQKMENNQRSKKHSKAQVDPETIQAKLKPAIMDTLQNNLARTPTPENGLQDERIQPSNGEINFQEEVSNKDQEIKIKKRKRKANRTGFPSVKKKKRFSLDKMQADSDRASQTPDSEVMGLSAPPSNRCLQDNDSPSPMSYDSGPEIEEEAQSGLDNESKRSILIPGTSLPKKNYLVAGLFSDYYKTSEVRSTFEPVSKKLPSYNPEDFPNGILPPPHYCGIQIRKKKQHFQLPYDLWWQHINNKLPRRDVLASWNYKKIKTNVFFDVKPTSSFEAQACHCSVIERAPACGDDCINRMTYFECDARSCPTGDKCTNNQIQKHRIAPYLERFMTAEKGWGIKTTAKISSGSFVMEYVGEVVSEKEFKLRMLNEYVGDTHHYCLHVDGGVVIDGHRMGGECRFVNHSCRPNCEMQKWTVNGLYRMALFTLRDIQPDEELTYDYNFSLFNPHEGQICHCGATDCRGVIGGRSQRVVQLTTKKDTTPEVSHQKTSSVEALLKRKRVSHRCFAFRRPLDGTLAAQTLLTNALMRPMTSQQKAFAKKKRCFLFRNVEKIKKYHIKKQGNQVPVDDQSKSEQMIMTGMAALASSRSVQTRSLAIVQDDPAISKVLKLSQMLREIYLKLITCCDSLDNPYANWLSKEVFKMSHYMFLIEDPIDLASIDKNISSGAYANALQFDHDLLRFFQNNIRYFGYNSPEGSASIKLRNLYSQIKTELHGQLEDIIGPQEAACFQVKGDGKSNGNDEDEISCICGQFEDEGLMIQCENCHTWQHCDCVGNAPENEMYTCFRCGGKQVPLDIKLTPQPEYASAGEVYYVSMLRERLQIKLGDHVYVLRAPKVSGVSNGSPSSPAINPDEVSFTHCGIPHKILSSSTGPSEEASAMTKKNYPTFKTVGNDVSTEDMDILRVERLWIDNKGDRFAFGMHYLRPHETFHEPTRKFFHNEVFKVSLYEVLPLDTIWGRCSVLDPTTFGKGRPLDVMEKDVYICEYRVDKSARLFFKMPKPKTSIASQKSAFITFDQRLKPLRTFTPHEIPDKKKLSSTKVTTTSYDKSQGFKGDGVATKHKSVPKTQHASGKTSKPNRGERSMEKLEATLQKLLNKSDPDTVVDASYLLEFDKRTRQKNIARMKQKMVLQQQGLL